MQVDSLPAELPGKPQYQVNGHPRGGVVRTSTYKWIGDTMEYTVIHKIITMEYFSYSVTRFSMDTYASP